MANGERTRLLFPSLLRQEPFYKLRGKQAVAIEALQLEQGVLCSVNALC